MAVTTYHYGRTQAAAAMTPPATPPTRQASSTSFFQLSAAKKRMHTRIQEQLQREKVAMEEDATLRGQAWLYLEDFLQGSPWEDIMDQIAIVRDAVPTMPELNSYGCLDEEEGTKACRRLFKAVVVWDELGHSLWKTLRAASEQRKLAQRQYEHIAARCADGGFYITTSRRSSERELSVSEASDVREPSVDLAHGYVCGEKQQQQDLTLSRELSSSSSRRDSSDSSRSSRGRTANHASPRSTIPKLISQNCVSAVRRTLGVFGESRTSLSMGRQQSR